MKRPIIETDFDIAGTWRKSVRTETSLVTSRSLRVEHELSTPYFLRPFHACLDPLSLQVGQLLNSQCYNPSQTIIYAGKVCPQRKLEANP